MKKVMWFLVLIVLVCASANAEVLTLIGTPDSIDPNSKALIDGSFEDGYASPGERPAASGGGSPIENWSCSASGWAGFWDNGTTAAYDGSGLAVFNAGVKATFTSDTVNAAFTPGDVIELSFMMNNNLAGGSYSVTPTLVFDAGLETEFSEDLDTVERTFSEALVYESTGIWTYTMQSIAESISLKIYADNSNSDNDQGRIDMVVMTADGAELLGELDLGDTGVVFDYGETTGNGGFEFIEAAKVPEQGWNEASYRLEIWNSNTVDSDGNDEIDIILPGGWKMEPVTGTSMGFAAGNSNIAISGDIDGDQKDMYAFVNAYNNAGAVSLDDIGYAPSEGEIIRVEFGFGTNDEGKKAKVEGYIVIDGVETLIYELTTDDLPSQRVMSYKVVAEDVGKTFGLLFKMNAIDVCQAALDAVSIRIVNNVIDISEDGGVASFDAALTAEPNGVQTVDFTIQSIKDPALDKINVSATSLTFDETNWTIPQTIQISSINDSDISDDRVYWVLGPQDPNLPQTTAQLNKITVFDDEAPKIVLIDTSNLAISEGGIQIPDFVTFEIQILGNAASDVTIDLAEVTDPNNRQVTITAETTPLVFTAVEIGQGVSKSVTVTAINDTDIEEVEHTTEITITSTSSEEIFNNLSKTLIVTILEDDCGAIDYDPADLNQDCKIDLGDFAIMASKWLNCYLPNITAGECP